MSLAMFYILYVYHCVFVCVFITYCFYLRLHFIEENSYAFVCLII